MSHSNFKTSHVIVYPMAGKKRYKEFAFQNISCYCLSTSESRFPAQHHRFQNISCYCLSLGIDCEIVEVSEFQNISCYCLSKTEKGRYKRIAISKHLMLLFISRISALFSLSPPLFPLYFLYFSIFYQPTPLSWNALLIIP